MTDTQEYMDSKKAEHQGRIEYYKQRVHKYNQTVKAIQGLYDTADSMSDDPDGWLQKAEIFGMILEKVGELHYMSIQTWKYSDALKKEAYALAIIQDRPSGRTVEQHREMAVLESQEWRWKIGEWEGLTKRWENAKLSIEEQIKIMKWKVKWELANREQYGMNNNS